MIFLFDIVMGRGLARLKQQDYLGANRDFHAAKVLWPHALSPVLLLGQAYILSGNLTDAQAWFEECLEERKDQNEADELVLEVAGLLYDLDVDEDWIRAWLDRVNSGLLRERSKAHFFFPPMGTLEEALRSAKAALEYAPEDAVSHAIVGVCYSQQPGQGEEAERWLRSAMELGGDNAFVCLSVANGYYILGDIAEGIRLSQMALQLEPAFDDALRSLAWGYLRKASAGDPDEWHTHRYEKVKEIYRKLIEHHPDDFQPRDELARVLIWSGCYEEALEEIDMVMKLQPSWPQSYMRRARIHHLRGELEEAAKGYQELLNIKEDHRWGRMLLGLVQIDMRRYEEALENICWGLLRETDLSFAWNIQQGLSDLLR